MLTRVQPSARGMVVRLGGAVLVVVLGRRWWVAGEEEGGDVEIADLVEAVGLSSSSVVAAVGFVWWVAVVDAEVVVVVVLVAVGLEVRPVSRSSVSVVLCGIVVIEETRA